MNITSTNRRVLLAVSTIALGVSLSACGGGGGAGGPAPIPAPPGGGAPAPTPTPTPPAPWTPPATITTPADLIPPTGTAQRSANDTQEFRQNNAAYNVVRSLYAYDNGWTGKGVSIGVVDAGFNLQHSELAGRVSDLSKDFGNNAVLEPGKDVYTETARNDLTTKVIDHGTLVAMTAVANRNSSGAHGIAPDASLVAMRVDTTYVNEKNADGSIKWSYDARALSRAIDHATTNKIPAIVASISIVTMPDATFINSEAQTAASGFINAGGTIVWAAGNEAANEPTMNKSALYTAEQMQKFVYVGGLSPDTTGFKLHEGSNKAGALRSRFIVAPWNVFSASEADASQLVQLGGTSFAAPMVGGAIALLISKWPQLSGQMAAEVLLNTARDVGAPGVDEVFGRGLLDIQAAIEPVQPTLATSQGSWSPVASSALTVSPAIGTKGLADALSEVTITDAYGRDFDVNASGLVQTVPGIASVTGLVQSYRGLRQTPVRIGNFTATTGVMLATGPVRDGEPVAKLSGAELNGKVGDLSFGLAVDRQPWTGAGAAGLAPQKTAMMAYAPGATTTLRTGVAFAGGELTVDAASGSTSRTAGTRDSRTSAIGFGWTDGNLRVGAGVVREAGQVLGARSEGTLQIGSAATTSFIESGYTTAIGTWSFDAYGSVGVTRIKEASASVLSDTSALVTSRLGFEASGPALGGLLSFGMAQPLVVERGSANASLSRSYDLETQSLRFDDRRVDLAGERRMLVSAGYARSIGTGTVRFGLVQGVSSGETGAVASIGTRF